MVDGSLNLFVVIALALALGFLILIPLSIKYLRLRLTSEKFISQELCRLLHLKPVEQSRALSRSDKQEDDGRRGILSVKFPSGKVFESGENKFMASCSLHLKNAKAFTAIATLNRLRIAEAFMNEDIDIDGEIFVIMHFLISHYSHGSSSKIVDYIKSFIFPETSDDRQANISAHYDNDADFFMSWLGEKYPVYSQYVFLPKEPISNAQIAKERKLALALEALHVQPGAHIALLGCGWGGFAFYLAERGFKVTALTLAVEQVAYIQEKIDLEGLGDQITVMLQDFYLYKPSRTFDAIGAIGLLPHVPAEKLKSALEIFCRLVKPGGYIYTDFCADRRHDGMEFSKKYIFPGGMTVRLDAVLHCQNEHKGLDIIEVHNESISYAKTCAAWAKNIEEQKETILKNHSEFFYRTFWLYLKDCVFGFTYDKIQAYRIVLRRRDSVQSDYNLLKAMDQVEEVDAERAVSKGTQIDADDDDDENVNGMRL